MSEESNKAKVEDMIPKKIMARETHRVNEKNLKIYIASLGIIWVSVMMFLFIPFLSYLIIAFYTVFMTIYIRKNMNENKYLEETYDIEPTQRMIPTFKKI